MLTGNGNHTPIGDMPLSVGIASIAVIACVAVFACKYGLEEYKRAVVHSVLLFASFVVLASDIFPYNHLRLYCRPVYDLLRKMQYSWRFLAIATVLITIIYAFSIDQISRRHGQRIAIIYGIVVLSVVLVQGKGLEDDIVDKNDGYYSYSMPVMFWTANEYLPRNTSLGELQDTQIITSDANVMAYDFVRDGLRSEITVSNGLDETGYVQLPYLWYPYYHSVDTNGKELEVIAGDYYKLCFAVPSGYEGKVYTYFKEPLTWRIAEIISLLALISLAVICLRSSGWVRDVLMKES